MSIPELGEWVTDAPWKARGLALIFIPHNSPFTTWESVNTVTDKRRIVAQADRGTIIAVWSGKWSTTSRAFAEGDAEKVAVALG